MPQKQPRKLTKPVEKKITLDDLGFYQPKEREIYRYFDGKEVVSVDPLTLYKRVIDKADDLDSNIKALNFPNYKGVTECHNNLVADLRTVFNVKPVEEGGLTETEVENLLAHFLNYCDTVKKNWSIIPIPSKAISASTPSTGVSPTQGNQNPPITNTLDSGSTGNVSSTNVPNQQPLVQGSPSALSTQAWSIGEIQPEKKTPEADKPNLEPPLEDKKGVEESDK